MDIWKWVIKKERQLIDQGQHRLSQIISDMPSLTCDDEHHRVDALYPEGLALARQAGDPWVELYLRHWYLQSQVLHRHNAKGMLKEAVALLDFAHQENTKDCPQRICAVQDLAACYGILDGPGYVEQRLEVTDETLSQINGSWPCYACVGMEKVSALLDGNRLEEAVQASQDIVKEIQSHGIEPHTGSELSRILTKVYIRQGEYKKALALISRAKNDGGGEGFLRHKSQLTALTYAYLGDYTKAMEHSLPFDEVLLSQAYIEDWCETNFVCAKHSGLEISDQLLHQFQHLGFSLQANGACRMGMVVFGQLFELALKSKAFFSAQIALEVIDNLVTELHKDLGASKEQAARKKQFETQTKAFLTQLNLDKISEKEFLALQFDAHQLCAFAYEQAHKLWPSSSDIIFVLSEIYQEFNQYPKARVLLENFLESHPDDEKARYALGECLLSHSDTKEFFERFDRLNISTLDARDQSGLYWLYSFAHAIVEEEEKTKFYLEKFLELNPDSKQANQRLAHLLTIMEDYSGSIKILNKLIEMEPLDQEHHWDRMVSATLLGDWSLVRDSAKAVNLELESESGPIEENFGVVRIRLDDQFSEGNFIALRTGPVTAIIKGVSDIGSPQYYGWKVVFDPTPLNRLDQQDEEGYACDIEGYYTLLFPLVGVLEKTSFEAFEIDGFHPGEKKLEALDSLLETHGAVLFQRSDENYVLNFINSSGEKEEKTGFYGYVLIPEASDFKKINDQLGQYASALENPMIWPDLLKVIGDIQTMQVHLEIREKYNIY